MPENLIYVVSRMRIGDEVAAVAAFHTRDEAKQWVEDQWAEKKVVWHDGDDGGARAQKEDDADETFKITPSTVRPFPWPS
jgi:hypothetical protein